MYFYGYRQHQPHAFVNKLNIITNKYKRDTSAQCTAHNIPANRP